MAYLTTSTNNFSATVVALVQKRLEQELRSRVVHLVDAVPGDWIPGTNLVRFVAYRDISVVTGTPTPGTPPWLTEGTPPTPHDLSITYDQMSAYQAGDVVRITDVALSESPHKLVQVAAERIAFHAARTLDQYMADIIIAGTSNTIFSGTSNTQTSHVAAGDVLTGLNVKAAVAQLASDAVPKFPDGYYHAVIHPRAVFGLMTDDDAGGWIDANKYTDAEPLLRGELGRYAGVRFMESAYAGIQSGVNGGGTGSIDVYSTVIYGQDPWAFGDLQTLQVYVHTDPVKGTDPLNQFIETGWKAMFGAMLLDSNGARYVRIESAGS